MRKLSDREKIEAIFKANDQAECDFLLHIAGVIVRSRFDSTTPAKRTRKAKDKPIEAER